MILFVTKAVVASFVELSVLSSVTPVTDAVKVAPPVAPFRIMFGEAEVPPNRMLHETKTQSEEVVGLMTAPERVQGPVLVVIAD